MAVAHPGNSAFSRRTSEKGDNHQSHSSTGSGKGVADDDVVVSPLKGTNEKVVHDGAKEGGHAHQPLFQEKKKSDMQAQRKRKAKGVGEASTTPDLNTLITDTLALVPSGLVKDCPS